MKNQNHNLGSKLRVILIWSMNICASVFLMFSNAPYAQAATYTFTQSSWTGGATSNVPGHAGSNETGWTEYSSKDSGLTAGTNLTMPTQTISSTQTSDTDFNAGTFSTSTVSGIGSSSSLVLNKLTPALIAHASSSSAGCTSAPAVTSALNTTGANFLVMTISDYGVSSALSAVSDSKGNTWIHLTNYNNAQDNTTIWYAKNATVGTNHTFSASGSCISISVMAFSNMDTANPFDVQNGNGCISCSTLQTGSVTPSTDYSLIVATLGSNGFGVIPSINLGFTRLDFKLNNNTETNANAYLIQTTAASVNPTWTVTGDNGYRDAAIAVFKRTSNYASSGTFTSGIISTANSSWNTLSWSATTPAGTSVSIKARSSNSATMVGATDFSSCSNITNGAALSTGGCVTNGDTYIQYQATLSTSDATQTPSLNDVTINYYVTKILISSAYDSGSAGNLINQLIWAEDSVLPAGTSVAVSIRTATSSAALTGASWTDFTNATTNCSKLSGTVTCTASAIPSAMKDAANDQFFQYKVSLTTSTASAPTVSSVSIQYVVNAPPEFDANFPTAAAGGVSVIQIATSTDSNFGKVKIDYSIKDVDSTTGSFTAGFVTPTLQYNIGSGWVNIPSQYLDSTALDSKAVQESSFTQYSSYWDAKSQIPTRYTATARIRVSLNDNEAANNTVSADSANFILDTKIPTNSIRLDASTGTVYATSTDDTLVSYVLSNDSSSSPDGLNVISGIWQTASSTSVSASTPWNFGSVTYPVVYLQSKDIYNNTTTISSVAPSQPLNMDIKDVTNLATGVYKEFVSWGVYTATSSAAFSKYELYRSSNAVNFSLINTITDVNLNYYADGSVASSTTYTYKLRIVDSDNDISAYSSTVSDQPNGQGGTDVTPPTITNVDVAETQSSWARITWTTDELSNSTAEYSISPSTAYNSNQSSTSMLLSHSITVTGLLPNTTYNFRVESTDITGNTTVNDNNGIGYEFTTIGGPTITNVSSAPTDQGAVITWNTDASSDSYVYYSTSANLSGALTAGNATLVSTSTASVLFQHRVTLSGLSAGSTYYFYVQSTDGNSNMSTDSNGGSYYTFQTVLDTNAPVISAISVPLTSATQAAVVWTTDEPGTSRVSWGSVSGVYDNQTTLDSTLTISHMAVLTDLLAATQYFYIVKSQDSSGNQAISAENDFTSAAANDIVYLGGGGGGGGQTQVVTDTTAPVITNISVSSSSLTSFGVVLTFNTNEDALGLVEYGIDAGYGQSSAGSSFKQSHSVTLSGLRMGTVYHFKVKALDKSGNESGAEDKTFTTRFLVDDLNNINVDDLYQYQQEIEKQIASILPSVVPPFVGKIQIINSTQNSAEIKWQTNLKSYSSLEYYVEGQSAPASENPYTVEISDGQEKTQDHGVTLENLQPNTKYHFRIKAYTLPQAPGFSSDQVFTTKAGSLDIHVWEVKISSFRVAWSTPDPSDATVEYKNIATGEINRKVDEGKKTFHEFIIDNLPQDTAYSVKGFSVNSKGNLMQTKQAVRVVTDKDSIAPAVSGLKIDNSLIPGNADKVQTLVTWTTNEPATSIVYYEAGSGSPQETHLANEVSNDQDSYVTKHVVVLGSLKAGDIYRIQIESADPAGNTTLSSIATIIVPRQSQSITDIIFKNFSDSFGFLSK
jgi:hypothetical protein